jgi:hypothetical protein
MPLTRRARRERGVRTSLGVFIPERSQPENNGRMRALAAFRFSYCIKNGI